MFRISALFALLFTTACFPAAAQLSAGQSPTIDVPAGARLIFSAKGEGVQIYTCTNAHWVLKAPDAKLFDAAGKQIGAHLAGPTWKLTDGGEVKGKAIATQASPDGASIPWLLVRAVPGSATGSLAAVAYIRRTETHGGAAPNEACTGDALSVPYSATYSFYAAR